MVKSEWKADCYYYSVNMILNIQSGCSANGQPFFCRVISVSPRFIRAMLGKHG